MAFLLGIDGGGSGCRAALAERSGRILGLGAAGPANIASDPKGAKESVLAATRAACADAGLASLPENLAAGLGLAGANAAGAADWLSEQLPFAKMRVETDAITATLGALGAEDGIVAALGTGSVFTLRVAGRVQSFGGWGFTLGDEGSGAALGRALLARALRAVDGFCEKTPLLDRLLDDHGGPAGVVTFAQGARPADFAALAPLTLSSTDPAAQAVWQASVADVARILHDLRRRAALPVTFLGGLGPAYGAALPDLPQRPARGTALDGALILAREAA